MKTFESVLAERDEALAELAVLRQEKLQLSADLAATDEALADVLGDDLRGYEVRQRDRARAAEKAALRAALQWSTKNAIHQTYDWQQCCVYCRHCAATVVAIAHVADCPVRVLAETMAKALAST